MEETESFRAKELESSTEESSVQSEVCGQKHVYAQSVSKVCVYLRTVRRIWKVPSRRVRRARYVDRNSSRSECLNSFVCIFRSKSNLRHTPTDSWKTRSYFDRFLLLPLGGGIFKLFTTRMTAVKLFETPSTLSHRECGQFRPCLHENFETFEMISTRRAVDGASGAIESNCPSGSKSSRIFQNFHAGREGTVHTRWDRVYRVVKKTPPLSEAISRLYIKRFCSNFIHIYYDYLKVMS